MKSLGAGPASGSAFTRSWFQVCQVEAQHGATCGRRVQSRGRHPGQDAALGVRCQGRSADSRRIATPTRGVLARAVTGVAAGRGGRSVHGVTSGRSARRRRTRRRSVRRGSRRADARLIWRTVTRNAAVIVRATRGAATRVFGVAVAVCAGQRTDNRVQRCARAWGLRRGVRRRSGGNVRRARGRGRRGARGDEDRRHGCAGGDRRARNSGTGGTGPTVTASAGLSGIWHLRVGDHRAYPDKPGLLIRRCPATALGPHSTPD